jgi:hypothetical protein
MTGYKFDPSGYEKKVKSIVMSHLFGGVGVNSCGLEGFAVPAPHVTPVVLLFDDKKIDIYRNHVSFTFLSI